MADDREVLLGSAFFRAVAVGALGGLALVGLPYLVALLIKLAAQQQVTLSNLLHPNYGYSLLLILPLVQGIGTGFVAGAYRGGLGKTVGIIALILGFDFILAMLVFREGVGCLVIAAPLLILPVAMGLGIGGALAPRRNRNILHASLVPLVVIAVAYDTLSAGPEYSNVISDAITINASPEHVWRYIVEHPENTRPPEYWMWQIGMPMPIQSTASSLEVGAARRCRFTDDLAFEEKITELVQNKILTFEVTAQPDHPEIIGHFSLDKGQLYIEANPDGTTTAIATSWYRIYTQPAVYFDWWASDIVRHVHFRVLDHIKALAEADEHTQVAMLNRDG